MKNGFGMVAILLACLFLAGCRSTDKEGFVRIDLLSDSIAVPEGFDPYGWMRIGDKAVIYSLDTLSLFSVYSLPDFGFLYSFGTEGREGADFVSAWPIASRSGDEGFYVLDLAGQSLSRFALGADTISLSWKVEGLPRTVYVDGVPVSDSVSVFTRMNFLEKSFKLSVLNLAKDSVVQDVECKTLLDEAFSPVNYPYLAMADGRLALVYKNYKRIEYYSVAHDGHLTFTGEAGRDYTKEDVARLKASQAPLDGPVDFSPGDEYLYLLQNAQDEQGKVIASRVEVYDWQGKGCYRLQLERPATKILADEGDGKLFALAPGEGSGKVYVYDIRRILDRADKSGR